MPKCPSWKGSTFQPGQYRAGARCLKCPAGTWNNLTNQTSHTASRHGTRTDLMERLGRCMGFRRHDPGQVLSNYCWRLCNTLYYIYIIIYLYIITYMYIYIYVCVCVMRYVPAVANHSWSVPSKLLRCEDEFWWANGTHVGFEKAVGDITIFLPLHASLLGSPAIPDESPLTD